MVFWVSFNIQTLPSKDGTIAIIPFQVQTDVPALLPLNVTNMLQTLDRKAKGAYIVFGYKTRKLLYFDVHRKGFLDLNTEISQFWVREPSDNRKRPFLTFMIVFLWRFGFTHLRWKSPLPITSPMSLSLAIDTVKTAFTLVGEAFVVIDSRRGVEVNAGFNGFAKMTYDFVLYWDYNARPQRWLVSPADLTAEDPKHPNNYFYYKRRLDFWREKYHVLEGENSLLWQPQSRIEDEEKRAEAKQKQVETLWKYYFLMFTRMLIDKPQDLPVGITEFITGMPDTLDVVFPQRMLDEKLAALNYMYPALCLYFATQFNSKYGFLFAWAQFWRLQHWLHLPSIRVI